MKVFLSCVLAGNEPYRRAVRGAIDGQGHEFVEGERPDPTAETPPTAALAEVGDADLVIVLIGAEYGAFLGSGLSAPHEEFRAAVDHKPVLAFAESGVRRGATQQAFLDEVTAWAVGALAGEYASPIQLAALVVLATRHYAVAVDPADDTSLLDRARAMLTSRYRDLAADGPALHLAIAAGAGARELVRVDEFAGRELPRDVQREAMFGKHPVFEERAATSVGVRGAELTLSQEASAVAFTAAGDLRLARALRPAGRCGQLDVAAVIEEEVVAGLEHLMLFAGWLLDRLDPTHTCTDLVVVAGVSGAGAMPWRTRTEHAANPRQGSIGTGTDDVVAVLSPPHRHRQALTDGAEQLAAELARLLRRQFRTRDAAPSPPAEPARRGVSALRRVRAWLRRQRVSR